MQKGHADDWRRYLEKTGNLKLKPLIKPKEDLEKAKLAIEDMKKFRNLKQLEDAWKGYLELKN
ncbi:MAG: hypothetical protein A2042_01585 [Candidatus Schekmanbacteria bacterium GWA2_38_11]|uniref:Uncharacterized protein n=1 Tax=Candidatus Schekmanbacteria bacterium GWA2_38_11 TaxID=1817876 RepID=A0A1F7RPN3_9BACT|nr:MAG: hypothetical protein A2042_01585 [Candidatus Schekmanbacteria bacterium GWA2_38_11]